MVLGIVQGLTEFLPVSSSGHLVLAQAAVGFSAPGVLVEVVLHVATLLAVVIVYRETLVRLLAGTVRRDSESLKYVGLLIVGTVPAGVVGLFLKDFFERAFDSLIVVGVSFLLTGAILWSTKKAAGRGADKAPTPRGALAVGLAQACAILPGISRSGSTVAAGMWLGLDPVRAAEYSFLLAIPAIAGAAVLQIPDLSAEAVQVGVPALALGFVAALVSGVAAIKLLVLLLRRSAFHRFAPYCWMLGLATLGWAWFGG